MQQCLLLFIFLLLAGTICLGVITGYRLFVSEKGDPQHVRGGGLLLLACALAFALRLGVPQMHHVFYDEFNYLAEAHHILYFGKAGRVLRGSLAEPEISADLSSRMGFPLLLAVVAAASPGLAIDKFGLASDGTRWLFLFNIALGVLSVALVFRIVWRATRVLSWAWWSAVALAMLPVHIKYSSSLSADVSVLFFFLLSLLGLLEWAAVRQKLFMLTALFAGAYSACIKPIYLPFLMVALLMVVVPLYRRKELRGGELSDLLYYVFCILVPMSLILATSAAVEVQNRAELIYSWGYLKKNLIPNLLCLLNFRQFNVVASLLAVVGIIQAVLVRRNAFSMVMVIWFSLGLVLLSGYYAGGLSYQTFTDSDRFFFTVALPFAFLVGLGIQTVSDRALGMGRPFFISISVVLFSLMAFNAVYSSRLIVSSTPERFVYKQFLLFQKTALLLPPEAYVVDANAAFIASATGRKAVRPDFFTRGELPRQIVYYSGEDPAGAAPDAQAAAQVIRQMYHCHLLVDSTSQRADSRDPRAYVCEKVAPALKEKAARN